MDILPEIETKLRGEAPAQEVPTAKELQAAVKLAKTTERNNLCPCGCGLKAKKCANGRRVLEFKRYLRGAIFFDFLVLCFVALIAIYVYCVATGSLDVAGKLFR